LKTSPRGRSNFAADDRVPELKSHGLRHGVAMEVYDEHGDLVKVRALLGYQRIDTTQIYASIRSA
jgi:site-specific recombinase XerD